ncbi:MAG: hypothetical protein JWM63_2552 [Gammaproteobacteria bacterium]|nr:hypothetical protein [Gammaproteobacteria bacterium]
MKLAQIAGACSLVARMKLRAIGTTLHPEQVPFIGCITREVVWDIHENVRVRG